MGLENLRNVSLFHWVHFAGFAFLTVTMSTTGCATRSPEPESKVEVSVDGKPATVDGKPIPDEASASRDLITKLQDRVQDLEIRLNALNDKINLEQGIATTAKTADTEVVKVPAAHAHPVPAPAVKTEVFAQDESVDRYREAKILYDSKRYADAVVEFSSFTKNYPDHALAAGAQYYVGMSYFKQKEYKLAEEELSRELVGFPHSQFTPDSLLALSEVSQSLNKPTRVLYYREKLLSTFPHSPQAKGVTLEHATDQAKDRATEPAVSESKSSPTAAAVAEYTETAATKEPALKMESSTPEAPVPPTAPEKMPPAGENE